jgi:hypothetical protein
MAPGSDGRTAATGASHQCDGGVALTLRGRRVGATLLCGTPVALVLHPGAALAPRPRRADATPLERVSKNEAQERTIRRRTAGAGRTGAASARRGRR